MLPQLPSPIWLLALGRLLSQVGTGFTLFYAPIFFVNHVGLSTTQVGLGLGSEAISGVLGRFLSGSLADTPSWGRRRTILLSTLVSALAAFALAIAHDFPGFVLGNLLMGLGIGLYWPATEAMVADMTTAAQRNEAYAVTRLADTLGLGIGTILAGLLIGTTGALRSLFIIDGISFLVFFGVIYVAIAETNPSKTPQTALKGWAIALRDRRLQVYVLVNIFFTTYIAQLQSTVPLYFGRFLNPNNSGSSVTPSLIGLLFTGHLVLSVVLQLPIARALNRLHRPHALMISALFWGLGFGLIGLAGLTPKDFVPWAGAAMACLGVATVAYLPAAASLVIDLAPPTRRGVYLGINSQCWAIGYFIGPTLGGWVLDQSPIIGDRYWWALALSIMMAVGILAQLDRMLEHPSSAGNTIR
jgi:MFS family permease